MIVYGAPVSPFVRKVLAFASAKGLSLELKPANPFDPSPEFVALSPFRKIPAFTDGDFSISDSTAIVTYLEAKYPDKALLPADPAERARAVWFDEFSDTIFVSAAGTIFFNRIVAPVFLKQEGDLAAADKAEKEALPPILDYLEKETAGKQYLVGGKLSLADISVASPFVNLEHAGVKLDAGKYPNLTKWLNGILGSDYYSGWVEQERKQFAG